MPASTTIAPCAWCRRRPRKRSLARQTGFGAEDCAALARTGVVATSEAAVFIRALARPRADGGSGAARDVLFVCPGGLVQQHGEPEAGVRLTHRVADSCPALRQALGSYDIWLLTAAELLALPAPDRAA